MASLRLMGLANLLLLLNPVTAVMEYGYIGPTPTSFGLVGIQSMAPRPTRPPNMDENNGELRKRRLPDSIYSRIPKSWCAFVNGDTDTPFSCSSKTCVIISDYLFHTSIACSPFDYGKSIVYTLCLDSTKYASMSTYKSFDTTVCSYRSSPHCGIATLPLGEYSFFCDSTTRRSTVSLEYLEDVLITATNIPPGTSITTSEPRTQLTTQPVASSSDGRLTAPAIAGIGVAIGAIIIGVIAGLGICLFLRRRKRKEGTNQPVAISTEPSNPQMQQGNPEQGWQIGAPVSSPNSQAAFLKDPEQPSPPYSSEPASIHNPHSSSISSPATPYDSNGPTSSTGLYPLSQNPSTTPPHKNKILPSLLPSVHKPGELPRLSNSSDFTAQPPSHISGVGHQGGKSRLENSIEYQAHEMATGSAVPNNPRGSGTSQSHPYHEISPSVELPIRQSSGTQSPPPLHPIHEAPQAYYNKDQAHGIFSSPTSRQSGSGAYYEAAHPPREISVGGGGSHSYSNSISSNTGRPPPNDMELPTSVNPAVVAPTSHINIGTYEGEQKAQYDIHETPATSHYIAYSPGMSPVTTSPLDIYHNNNAQ
ncbi:hypothetical protein MMC31_001027 [Peltigera leucophlebia]|nr:hypothetical protein [Peltigera leucophlebia]